MKRLNGWVRLGIVLSTAWVLLVSYIYVDELLHHPSYALRYHLDGYFGWVEDSEATKGAHAGSKAKGQEFSERYVLLKPTFSAAGYFKLTFFPVIVGWLGSYIIIWIFRWVREGFRT